eukprot:s5775_g1.t1
MAAARAADVVHPDDSASRVGSTASWNLIRDDAAPVAAQPTLAKAPPPVRPQDAPSQSGQAAAPDHDDAEAFPTDMNALFHGPAAKAPPPAAPATQAAQQAAQQVLGSAQKQAARLACQKARASRRGARGVRWGQMPAINAQNFQLPPFVQQLGAKQGERSILVIDSRDRRIQSPFQGWLVDEILLNAQSGVNILVDRQLVRSPNTGYHLNLFYVRTLDGFKVIIVGSMTSYGTVPCAKWDEDTGKVMAHKAFQPFRWPKMTDESSTWVDVKVKVEGDLLLHLELRGYRSDQDMTVQMNYLNDYMIMALQDHLFVPSCVVTIFQGWRVIATSFEVGGRLYACSDGGVVVALDYPLCHFEIRMTATSSPDSIGLDADRLEFRFRSSGDKLDVSCSQAVVPATWLVVSRVSGPTLIKNAKWCREHHARIEGPDQAMQLSQLAGIHAHWTAATEAASLEETGPRVGAETGPRVGAVAVDSHPSNLHLTCESPLYRAQKAIVPCESLALQAHDVETEKETVVLPPVTGGPSVVPAGSVSRSLRQLAGPVAPNLIVAPNLPAEVSVTQPGQAAPAPGMSGGALRVHRRSLESRLYEDVADAAVTPQAFLEQVSQATSSSHGSGVARAPRGPPVSYGPAPVIEEALLRSPYANLALIASMEVRSASEFVIKVHDWSSTLEEDVRDTLLGSQFMLEQYWSIASSVEKAFFASTAQQLGFGMKVLKNAVVEETHTPLLDQENAARWKWASKLEEIGKRAGGQSKLLLDTSNSVELSSSETAKLRQLVLSSGAPRTMAAHISAWERFEDWATSEGFSVFPLTSDLLLKYALVLDDRECGPTVVPSFRTAVRWVTSKLAISCPDLAHPGLIAVQNEIIKKRATTLKEAVPIPFAVEAVPIPFAVVGCLELFVMDRKEPDAARLFVWWWLCMVFASLRFDDATHVKPAELVMQEEGLFGVAWQTKVERRRRGTKFVVPKVGFRDSGWLEEGFTLLLLEDPDRDFWIRDLNTRTEFRSAPASYQRSLQWLKFFARHVVYQHQMGTEAEIRALVEKVGKITAHSARVTLLDAAVHAGRTTEEIGLQANWKNPGPLVLKYTRNRSTVPAQMVQQLVKDIVEQHHPFEAREDVEAIEADESALDEVQFFVKTHGRNSHDYRYHCSVEDDPMTLACGRLLVSECTEVGSALPDASLLCKYCAKARPDVASRCFAVL